MCLSSKNVVPLGRASVLWFAHRYCWKEKTLEVYWVSETAKTQKPQDQTTSVRAYRHGLLLL